MRNTRIPIAWLASAAAALLAAEALALMTVGLTDQVAFLVFTLPFCVVIAGVFTLLAHGLRQRPVVPLAVVTMVLGIFCGIAFTTLVRVLLGAWIGAFSMPVLLCWSLAGAMAGISAPLLILKSTIVAVSMTLLSGGILLGLSMLAPQVLSELADERLVHVVVLRHIPGPPPLTLEDPYADQEDLSDLLGRDSPFEKLQNLLPTERQKLVDLVGGGTLKVERTMATGGGQLLRIVLVLLGPVREPKSFRLPAEGSLYLVQTEKGWNVFPLNAQWLDRSIVISDRTVSINGEDVIQTGYTVEHAGGSKTGGDAISWQ